MKTYTVGAKRRAKAGRPRKDAPREPNGKPQRKSVKLAEAETIAPALKARCRQMGWEETEENMQRAKSQDTGHKIGQFYENGHITRWERDALMAWEAVYRDYLAAVEAPSRFARGIDPSGARGPSAALSVAEVKARANAYMGAEQALGMAGRGATSAAKVITEECEHLSPIAPEPGLVANLKAAAAALADHFGIARA